MKSKEILCSLNAKLPFFSNLISAKSSEDTSNLLEAEPSVIELGDSKTSWLKFHQW